MKNLPAFFLLFVLLLPLPGFTYNYGDLAALPDGIKKLLPENPDILAAAVADLNGDKLEDYIVVNQYIDAESNNDEEAKKNHGEGRRYREIIVLTADKEGKYAVAARTKRAVLCSDCGAKDEDPFLTIKALTKSFTILHKFTDPAGETWGITAKFGYSKRDNKWQLVSFSGGDDSALKPDSFGLINLEDFDINFYMGTGQVMAKPDAEAKKTIGGEELLFTENGALFAIMPDKTGFRYVAGDRNFRKVGFPNLSPDRKKIAFVRNNDLYVMDADGKNEKKIIRDVLKISTYNYENEGTIYAMKWSPDGKYFAVNGLKSNMYYDKGSFYVWSQDGLTKTAKSYGTDDGIGSICWAPDSSKLAYYRSTTLTVMSMNSGDEKQLINVQGKSGLAWSRDGNRLITVVEGGYGIVDAGNGSTQVIKCRASSGQGQLYWSKDEKSTLLFTSDYIFKVALEEGAEMKIVAGPSYGGLIDGLFW